MPLPVLCSTIYICIWYMYSILFVSTLYQLECGWYLEQFLVSKLVECCIPSGTSDQFSTSQSSQVMSLLHQLTVESDPSLHDYIRVSLCLLTSRDGSQFSRVRNAWVARYAFMFITKGWYFCHVFFGELWCGGRITDSRELWIYDHQSTTLTNMFIWRKIKFIINNWRITPLYQTVLNMIVLCLIFPMISVQRLISSLLMNALFQELQPFPEIDLFDTIRSFHQKLSQNYSPRDHLLKVRPSHCRLSYTTWY